jgi:hypothetical protein
MQPEGHLTRIPAKMRNGVQHTQSTTEGRETRLQPIEENKLI